MQHKQELTRLGKEIISVGLVGQNAEYKLLKKPEKEAYPEGLEVRYSDDYLTLLNANYSLEDILDSRKKGIAMKKCSDVSHFVMGSPLQNGGGEDALAYMLINSAQAGLWQPFIIDVPKLTDTTIKTSKEYLQAIEDISPTHNKGRIEAGILFGIARAKRGGFALPTKYDNKVIVIPSQEFIEYCSSKN